MPFPITAREIYDNNTLEEVILQLRFPTILQVGNKSPVDFQNSVRSYYPLYEERKTGVDLPKELTDMLAGFPITGLTQQTEHQFLTEDRARFIALTQDFIAISEKDYKTWNVFRAELTLIEQIFREEYSPAFYSRVGLRYRNVITKAKLGLEESPWRDLLNPSLLGNLAEEVLTGEVIGTRTQTTITLPDQPGGRVVLRHGLSRSDDQTYEIDTDFYLAEKCQPEEAYAILDGFNKWGGNLIRWAIKPALREAMGPNPI